MGGSMTMTDTTAADIAGLVERLAERITEDYGPRCPDYEEECAACFMWKAHDVLTEKIRHVELLLDKIGDGLCGCSYDHPGDICLHHSPQLKAARDEIQQLKDDAELVTRLRAEGADAFHKHYSLGMFKICAEAADMIEAQAAHIKMIAQASFVLTPEQWEQFTADLDTSAQPNAAMVSFLNAPRDLEDRIAALEAEIAALRKRDEVLTSIMANVPGDLAYDPRLPSAGRWVDDLIVHDEVSQRIKDDIVLLVFHARAALKEDT